MINNDDDLNVIEFFANQSPNHVIDGSSILFCFFLVNEISKSNSPEYLQNILQWNKERKQVGWRIQNPQTKNTQHSNWKKFFFQFEKKYSNVVDCVMFEHWTKKNMNILSENWIFCFASSIYTEFGQEVWPNKLN